MQAHEAYIGLNMMKDIGPVRVRNMMDALGDPVAIFTASRDELSRIPGLGEKTISSIIQQRDSLDIASEMKQAKRLGAHIITPADESYPKSLANIYDPPLALYVKGGLKPSDKHSLALVGSRRATHYGIQTADRLAYSLAQSGFTITSGLARGIDAAAHRGAIKAKGRTIAVLGTGIDTVYPAEHEELAEEVARHGAVLSEFPIGTKANRQTFPMRNRIVSGLSAGVVVVEAKRGSGAEITAQDASEQGRQVFAVPGRIDNPLAGGCHKLIKQGAKLVEGAQDVLEEFEYLFAEPVNDAPEERLQVQLNEVEKHLLSFLEDEAVQIDTLSRSSGIPIGQLNASLMGLEIKNLIRMLPGRLVEKLNHVKQRR